MDDRDFFDELYQMWSKTTGADDRYWMPEAHFDNSGRFNIYAIDQDESRKLVGSGLSDADSDFLTAIHGCFADLYRRLNYALDEADRADLDRDSRECRIAELELELIDMKNIVAGLSKNPPWTSRVHG